MASPRKGKPNRIQELRKKKGLDQEKLAEFLCVGVGAVRSYEQEISYPTVDNLKRLADLFGCSVDYILKRSDSSVFKISDEELAEHLMKILRDSKSSNNKKSL
jgi:transcriptional regulator with XRE-family HTH domain